MNGDDLFVWPDGSYVLRANYCSTTDSWRGDDFRIVAYMSAEWLDIMEKD